MYRLRPATASDAGFLADVTISATRAQGRLADGFDEAAWRAGFVEWTLESIEDPGTELYVVDVDERPAGRLRVSRTPEAVELNGIQLHPDIQNRGIGTAIITDLESEAVRRGVPLQLNVERDNPNARRLYDRLGFVKVSEDGAQDVLRWTKGVEQNQLWNADVAARYDTPDTGMFADDVIRPTVARLAELAAGGRALEFAIGTGRVAVPLAGHGVPVSGIELSTAMLDQLRTKASAESIPVEVGDMATTRTPGEFTLVYLVFNTISNLLTQEEQVACFRNAARHLSPGGRFVIELWVPELRRLPPGIPATVGVADPGYILLDTYDVLQQHVVSHHFHFGEGTEAHLGRTPHRYIWPAELDLMAQLAGFTRESRHADWSGTPFTADSPSHVSVYRLADA
ncbi:GNAT superfamily N-acetyltransferase/SAM-dependent methyltransferase [Kribbella aluminosa]|uniref:GNAT superfamily N-acetyltransferase/SAM-dependent methyltransferase n=1 Tax=Kribbella aluminosa TaxID=416017 RepID=A0ABS4UF24_9ACTN|nr:bifunctional GNAT family N-acetyltransferase/class I SAM-dependent methyltransferase [Kribbella aluminosa]MBP2350171.1 GNAT superfamily N-acetyltransferase/SAM-dependent methyltransferase [Kribbella aluminosa]